jgi:hypothetical protein
MVTIQRGPSLVHQVVGRLKRLPSAKDAIGASKIALDRLESRLMVELPPSLRTFLEFDFTFSTLGKRFQGRHRFGTDPAAPSPRITSVRKLAEAKTDLGWTDSRLRAKVVRLPNLPGQPWNALYLGEARRDGELCILGFENEDTLVRVYPRYTAFDLYLCDQAGILKLNETQRLDDLESHVALNPELGPAEEEEEGSETDF